MNDANNNNNISKAYMQNSEFRSLFGKITLIFSHNKSAVNETILLYSIIIF